MNNLVLEVIVLTIGFAYLGFSIKALINVNRILKEVEKEKKRRMGD